MPNKVDLVFLGNTYRCTVLKSILSILMNSRYVFTADGFDVYYSEEEFFATKTLDKWNR